MRELKIPYGTEEIKNEYNNLIGYDVIVIPPTVRVIKNSFNNCKDIKSIVFETEIDSFWGKIIDDIYDKGKEICHVGISYIDNSFNSLPLKNLKLPYTLSNTKNSFSNCNNLEELTFEVLNDPKKRHKGYGIICIDSSFNSNKIKQITIPATTEKIISSFKSCSELSNLQFQTSTIAYIYKYEEGVYLISDDSFEGSKLSNVSLPSTVKGINTFSFQKSNTIDNFASRKYDGYGSYEGDDTNLIYESIGAAEIFIPSSGKLDERICKHLGDHELIMLDYIKENNIELPNEKSDRFSPYRGGVILSQNDIIAIIYEGTRATFFFPDVINEEQKKSLTKLIGYMNDRQNSKKNSGLFKFQIHIYYKYLVYDLLQNGEYIGLREFRDFLIVNNICGETDFNYIEEKSKLL